MKQFALITAVRTVRSAITENEIVARAAVVTVPIVHMSTRVSAKLRQETKSNKNQFDLYPKKSASFKHEICVK